MSKKIKVRPGKTQSKAGFIVGIMFCLIGIFVAIPMAGLFGVLWTGVAVWITYSHYRNGFTDKPISNRVIEIEDDGSSATVRTGAFDDFRTSHDVHMETDSGDIEGRLRQLQSLYQQELITREEYENKRQEILGRL
ncbi:MAG: SHOCT domain-containing protein [Lachnospiraceae bacterium]|nr:SHOCT domain-containing protein [Lachnospiraceae bacterium]